MLRNGGGAGLGQVLLSGVRLLGRSVKVGGSWGRIRELKVCVMGGLRRLIAMFQVREMPRAVLFFAQAHRELPSVTRLAHVTSVATETVSHDPERSKRSYTS